MFPVHHLVAGLIIGLIVVSTLIILVVLMRRGRRAGETIVDAETAAADEGDREKSDDGLRRYSWKKLEALTGGFDPSAVIGEGGFSTVYLARFADSCAAVKVQRHRREFRQELDVLRGVRHRGLVRLLGYCDDERDECALVFEYVPDGTLHSRLHGPTVGPPLPWSQRMSIAHQLASALQYLHEWCDPHVIHADVKAPNILLNSSSSSFRSVLCDFGSARSGFSSAVAHRRGEQMVASPGYIDPHLVRTGVVSRKSDVYSFGMVMMELVTGREAVGVDKREVARAVEAGRVGDVVDGRLAEYDGAEAACVAALAVRCVGEQPSLRPSMGEVVKVLEEQVGKSIEEAGGLG